MPGTCPVCGGPVTTRRRGRPSVYCSRACQARAYRARKDADTGTAMSDRHAARRAAWHAALVIENALADGWETLDRYGADRPRVEAALHALSAELERRAGSPMREENPETVTEPAVPVVLERAEEPRAQEPPAVTRRPVPSLLSTPAREENQRVVTESERERVEREEREDRERWERDAAAERAQFEARLKPVAEFGEGYQMAEWPGTGRYYLVYEGERIGHATKKAFTSRWEARTSLGSPVPGSGTYATRREALAEVALHHQHTTRKPKKRS